jgi:hypothetical protein
MDPQIKKYDRPEIARSQVKTSELLAAVPT